MPYCFNHFLTFDIFESCVFDKQFLLSQNSDLAVTDHRKFYIYAQKRASLLQFSRVLVGKVLEILFFPEY